MGRYDWEVGVSVSVNNNYSDTQSQITVTANFVNVGWSYKIGVSASVACSTANPPENWVGTGASGIDSTVVSDNRGSVSAGSYTFIVNKGDSAQTYYVRACIKDTSSNSYAGGYTRYSGVASCTVSAITKYTLTLNQGTGVASWTGAGTYNVNTEAPTRLTAATGYTLDYCTEPGYGTWTSCRGKTVHDDTWSMTRNRNVYAYATPNQYTVTYDGNGATSGATASNKATYDADFQTTKNGFVRKGYLFDGWSTSKSAQEGGWKLDSFGVYESGKVWKWNYDYNLTLYAWWKAKTVTVTFDKNDGSEYTAQQSFTYDVSGNRFGYRTDGTQLWNKDDWSRPGYKLIGWSADKDAAEPTYEVYNDVVNDWIDGQYPSIKLYAVWQPLGVKIKVGSSWKEGQAYVKTPSGWKQGQPYVKSGGTWKTM